MRDAVKEYYGKTLKSSDDLKTNACCVDTAPPDFMRQALGKIHDEVARRYYGCGLIMPQLVEGTRILDLGSGSGRDCFLLSQFVGEQGYVLGVDMTDEQLAVANKYIDHHMEAFGYSTPNVAFKKGYIERLDALNLPENSFDIIISNCVINLSPDKEAVLREAWRLLKPGGEMYFSDVYADRRVPRELMEDPVLYGECLSGALYWNDFHNLARKTGFADPRLVEDRPLEIDNSEVHKRIGHINFYSATYRLFKLPQLEPHCEDYGQAVVYKGTIPRSENLFVLDKHHKIEKERIFPICGNTWRMLHDTRFAGHFEFHGNWDTHYGIFEGCGTRLPFDSRHIEPESGSPCCSGG